MSLLREDLVGFRRRARDKKYDPMELKNRISYMVGNYLEIDHSEQDLKKLVGFNKHMQE